MWAPGRFDDYRDLYPATPPLARPDEGPTDRFVDAWSWSDDALDRRVRNAAAGVRVLLVRGYLGNWMPGNLVAPTEGLRAAGVDATLLRNAAGATVEANVARLQGQIPDDGVPLLLCGHSKGGLECLALADRLGDRVVGVILSQTPRGPSGVLESLLLKEHQHTLSGPKRRAEEWVQRLGLHAIGAAEGGRQLTRERLAALIDALDRPRPFPVWQTASWSDQPTTWLDSFHGRLGEIRPGCAHDGQFFLEDLIWPGLPHVLLPRVDHAQPVMGGFGFDPVRYWKVLVALIRAPDPGRG